MIFFQSVEKNHAGFYCVFMFLMRVTITLTRLTPPYFLTGPRFVLWYFCYIRSWKESLNSDFQQFYQYQQNKQPHLPSNHWTFYKRPWHMALEIQILALEQAWKCGRIKFVEEWYFLKPYRYRWDFIMFTHLLFLNVWQFAT